MPLRSTRIGRWLTMIARTGRAGASCLAGGGASEDSDPWACASGICVETSMAAAINNNLDRNLNINEPQRKSCLERRNRVHDGSHSLVPGFAERDELSTSLMEN